MLILFFTPPEQFHQIALLAKAVFVQHVSATIFTRFGLCISCSALKHFFETWHFSLYNQNINDDNNSNHILKRFSIFLTVLQNFNAVYRHDSLPNTICTDCTFHQNCTFPFLTIIIRKKNKNSNTKKNK